jgi:D-sedoheptulose 7-phosphate isomerase
MQEQFDTYRALTQKLIAGISYKSVNRLIELLLERFENGAFIFIAGNGGSAATASHFHEDLCYGSLKGINTDKRFKALCLLDSTPYLTSLANDFDYSLIFREQMRNYATQGSLFVGITCSGNSKNILYCIDYSNENAMSAYCLLGFDGGLAAKKCRDYLLVPNDDFGIVESVHSFVLHYVVTGIHSRLKQKYQ